MRATPRPMLSRGPGDRDEELAARVLGFVLEAGDAAEQPQGDAFDPLAAALRDERVRELMGEDRGEEHGGGEDRGRPIGPAGVGFEVGEHARGEGVGEQAADEQQAPVDTDLDAADAAEADGRGQRGSFPVLPYNGATSALVPSRFFRSEGRSGPGSGGARYVRRHFASVRSRAASCSNPCPERVFVLVCSHACDSPGGSHCANQARRSCLTPSLRCSQRFPRPKRQSPHRQRGVPRWTGTRPSRWLWARSRSNSARVRS